MKKKSTKTFYFFLITLCLVWCTNLLQADEKFKALTVKDLPFKTELTEDYIFMLSKGYDELNVIETYVLDIYSKTKNNIVISESWTAKQMPGKEFSLYNDLKLTIKSEQSIVYENYVALYFITVRFYWQKLNEQKLITEFTYRKMY